jgi:hypothetical protein
MAVIEISSRPNTIFNIEGNYIDVANSSIVEISVSPRYMPPPSTSSLASWWPFVTDAQSYATSAVNVDEGFIRNPIFMTTTNPTMGTAIEIIGRQNANLTMNFLDSGSTAFDPVPSNRLTWHFWIRCLNPSSSIYTAKAFFGKNLSYSVGYTTDTNKLYMSVYSASTYRDFTGSAFNSGSGWNFISYRYDGSYIKIGLNGTYVSSSYTHGLSSNTNAELVFGGLGFYLGNTTRYYMADAGYWLKALTDDELDYIYNDGKGLVRQDNFPQFIKSNGPVLVGGS